MPKFKKTRGFRMKGYSAFDEQTDFLGSLMGPDNSPKKQMMPEETMNTAFYQKKEVPIPTKNANAVTDANIEKFSKDSGYSVADINSLIAELSATGGGGTEDDFDMTDVISAVQNKYETNVDEID